MDEVTDEPESGPGLSDGEVARLLPALSERARASTQTVSSFRPPQVGIVEQVASNWHHFVVGRRGVGKSMLLLNVADRARKSGQPVAYIDVETLRDNPYPDVLIRLLMELTGVLDRTVRDGRGAYWRRRRVRRTLNRLSSQLDELLRDPQEASHRVSQTTDRSRSRRLGIGGGAAAQRGPLAASADAAVDSSTSATVVTGREASFVRTKLQGLQAEATEFRDVLRSAVAVLGGQSALIVLDDFYFIPRDNQPDVLSYLQQVVKGLNIWLKVGAVEHRLNEFEDGDPPRGLQMTQDAGKVSMDVTLADWDHTKRFLEGILSDICTAVSVQMHNLVTERARIRLVLASGGVPRDYLNLVLEALGKASRRSGEPNRPRNKITAEDVTVTAPEFLKQKESDLLIDARPEDVDRLRGQLNELLNFCLAQRRTNVFLVESRHLREQQWGRDIAALSDLRFFHRIGNTTVKSSAPIYVGARYEAFALDLSSYSGQRVQTREVAFWTTDGAQQLRAVTHVYTPETAAQLREMAREQAKRREKAPKPRLDLDPAQLTLEQALQEIEDELLAAEGNGKPHTESDSE